MSTLSTHILDISTGTPAEGVTVSLSREGDTLVTLVTNAQGRIATFSDAPLPAGRYCLTAETGAWFTRAGARASLPGPQIDFGSSARRQMTISICRFSSPRADGRPIAAVKPGCPAWIVTQRAETAPRPGKVQPPPGMYRHLRLPSFLLYPHMRIIIFLSPPGDNLDIIPWWV